MRSQIPPAAARVHWEKEPPHLSLEMAAAPLRPLPRCPDHSLEGQTQGHFPSACPVQATLSSPVPGLLKYNELEKYFIWALMDSQYMVLC